jgi:hypothetical protein
MRYVMTIRTHIEIRIINHWHRLMDSSRFIIRARELLQAHNSFYSSQRPNFESPISRAQLRESNLEGPTSTVQSRGPNFKGLISMSSIPCRDIKRYQCPCMTCHECAWAVLNVIITIPKPMAKRSNGYMTRNGAYIRLNLEISRETFEYYFPHTHIPLIAHREE